MSQLRVLTPEQHQRWLEDGFLVIRGEEWWTSEQLQHLKSYTEDITSWPETAFKWMQYYETSSLTDKRILQRVENFFPYHVGFNEMFNGKRFIDALSDLFGEQAVLYKEKINFKLPGAQGFKPHQDAQAGWSMYGHTLHVSVLCSLDPATEANGCLELVRGKHREGLLGPEWQELPDDVVNTLKWEIYPTNVGDMVFFGSYVPHRSGPNTSDRSRRVLYATYNRLGEGDYREQYYADKRKSFPPDIEREPGKVYQYKI